MPPLREHAEDIPELVTHFLRTLSAREGREPCRVQPDAMDLMMQYRWPGNVRELENICERAHVLSTNSQVTAELVSSWLTCVVEPEAVASDMDEQDIELVCDGVRQLEDIERAVIVATLTHHDGHRQRSASALGIGVRTLGLKLKKWKDSNLVPTTI